MRPWLFVACFSAGVTLMLLSGYVPQSASARGSNGVEGEGGGPSGEPAPRTLSRAVSAPDYVYEPRRDWEQPTVVVAPAETAVEPLAAETQDEGEYVEPEAPEAGNPAAVDTPLEPRIDEPMYEEPPVDEPVETADGPEAAATLSAHAGADRVVWIGWNELVLDGTASRNADGGRLQYAWRQTGGPVWLAIDGEDRPKARVTGFSEEDLWEWRDVVYEFELTVTNAAGEQASDVVAFTVKVAPPLKVTPRAERFVQVRDGYRLGHYEAWQTNSESYASTFEVRSEIALTFTRVGGSTFDLVGDEHDGAFVYMITVYGQAGAATSWVEFLVDTADRIPGVLILNVTWEGR